ncbi:MAG TPA: PAS domain-containing sensor histidine kinase [Tepidisphaeraceae bacterium]|nr:PAS domain-containing sensor histidine kinase [Tepidisphaeraceae bacterium]
MDGLFKWLGGNDVVPGSALDVYWSWLTIALSIFIALGCATIAYNRYFQKKLARTAQCASATRRLWMITIFSIICGSFFYWYDMPWAIWRLYDCVLLFLLYTTWSYAIRMRGLSLVDERLSQLSTLEESARRYREMAELLPQMVWTAREGGEIDFANQRWAEYVGDGRTWLDAIHPDERVRVEGWWAKTLRSRKSSSIECRLGGAAGYRTFVISANPIIGHAGVKWLGACADIQAQKMLAAAREMQAKRRAFFLNALSHDLRAPLNNVVLNAELLKIVPPDEVKSRVVTIVESAKSAGDYVSRLLDFARAGGEEQNRIEPLSIVELLNNLQQRFHPLAAQKNLFIQIAADHDLEVRSDRQKLERLVANLVDNAVKYTRTGGVTLSLIPRDDNFSLRVTDTGMGVPLENAPYLFDEFYQVNNIERDRSKGFGMGLAICKYLATQLGGSVRLINTSEQGSSFEVTLPIECPADSGKAAFVGEQLAAAPP